VLTQDTTTGEVKSMDGSKKFERVSKTGRSIRWTQHHWVRCTDIESAMELEDSFEPKCEIR
jgi:hypothetical protein